MIPASFDYAVARDVGHAIQLLRTSGGEGKVLAGGQSLIPLMKFRLAQPALLIDINRVAGLSAIKENGDLRIGALVRENDLEAHPIVRQRYPILVETAAVIADPLVRNLATIGGNLAHADPANDHPATMLAVRASVVAQGPKGERVIPIDELFVDTFTTSLAPDEILTPAFFSHASRSSTSIAVPGSRYGTPRRRGMSTRMPRVTMPLFRF